MVKLRKYTVVKSILEIIILTFLYAMLDNMAGIKKYAFIVGLCIVICEDVAMNALSPPSNT